MRNVLLVSLLFTVACAQRAKDPRQGTHVDPDVAPYVADFEDIYGVVIWDIPITFDDLEGNYIGICRTWDNGYREIFLDKDNWENSYEIERYAVVFHELGHCQFGLKHNNSVMEDGCAYSLMNEYQPSLSCLQKHWDHYVKELH